MGKHPTDRGKSGPTRRRLTDGRGVPIGLAVDGANRNDCKMARETIAQIAVERPAPTPDTPQGVCLDKGDDDDGVRARGELRHPHNALFLQQVTDHAHVIMISKLAPEEAAALGFHKAADLDEAMALATRLAGKPRQTVIVPFGNTTVARVRDDHSTAVGTLEVSA